MISDDFTFTGLGTGSPKISHVAGTTVYTANALYSYCQDAFDELDHLSYDVPMSAQTPTAYSVINSYDFNASTDTRYLKGGSITVNPGGSETIYANIYTLGSDADIGSITLFIEQNGSVITGWWGAGHIDILVKVKDAGSLIDSGYITVHAREYGYLYDWNKQDVSGGGRNPFAISISSDINNQTSSATVSGWSDIALTFGNANHDLSNGNGSVAYGLSVDLAGRTMAQWYEYSKYITRRGATSTINGIQGQMYQAVNSYTPVKPAPFGTFAGGKYFGAKGVWVTNYAANQQFQLIDNTGTIQAPPNTVYVNITSIVSGDRVSVFRLTGVGGSINKTQYTISSRTASTIVMTTSLGSDTPQAGYLRVVHSGTEYLFTYTSWSGSTFSGVSPNPTTNTAASDYAFVTFLDKQATGTSMNNSLIYSSDIPVRMRVRKKGILPFEIDGTITSTGFSQAAIRTTDAIVT